MGFKTALIVLTNLLFISQQAVAGTPDEATLRQFLKTKLSYPVAASCKMMERTYNDSSGPFEQTDYCNESSLKDLKSIQGKVYRVVDGDTIHFYVGSRLYAIRMLGIDTPELHFLSNAQPFWGVRAKESLMGMVQSGDTITLELDKTRCDRYGRILGHVFKNKINLNYEQVRRGFAANYCIYPNILHCNAYSMAYVKAAQERLGVHTDTCFVTPYVWRRGMSGELMNKRLKDTRTDEMYNAAEYHRVPVAYRMFFPDTVQ